jgi:hypothetical protein
MESDPIQQFAEKYIDKKKLIQILNEDFDLLPKFLEGLSSPTPRVRYGCGSILMEISAKYPERLYPQIEDFIGLLNSRYRILIWNSMAILANLCAFDKERKFDSSFDKYFDFINDEYMVTVSNVVGNSGKIAQAKPYLVPKILETLLKINTIKITAHLTEECKLVIAEHAIRSMDMFYDKLDLKEKNKVLAFVKSYVGAPRKALNKEAVSFLKRWDE